MGEEITAKEVYEMFANVKDEIHNASETYLKTQVKCHEIFNKLETDLQIHTSNTQLHCSDVKKKECGIQESPQHFLKSLYMSVVGWLLR